MDTSLPTPRSERARGGHPRYYNGAAVAISLGTRARHSRAAGECYRMRWTRPRLHDIVQLPLGPCCRVAVIDKQASLYYNAIYML